MSGARWHVRPAELMQARSAAVPGAAWLWRRSGKFGGTVMMVGWWEFKPRMFRRRSRRLT
jgi:hypothetical protein